MESFAAGEELDIDIYDASDGLASIQFPQGQIIVGLPAHWLRVHSRCDGLCEDLDEPKTGPVAPR